MVKNVEELNEKAEKLLNAGNTKELEELAREHGLDSYMVELYDEGALPCLCPDAATFACGKLDVEVAGEKMQAELAAGIAEYLKQQVQDNTALASGIAAKPLNKLCDKIYGEAKKRRNGGNCVYIPPFEVFQMAKAYYLEV